MLATIFPESIEPWFAFLLLFVSFGTSAVSAAFGLGGGVLLIAIMGLGMPLAALVPVHGAVQLGSNAGRALLRWRNATPWILLWFGVGSVLGTIFAGRLTLDLPETLWRLSLGLFILVITWLPKPKFGKTAKPIVFLNGMIAAFLTMFFGATGPFVMSINAAHSNTRHAVVATHAIAMTMQHFLKIMMFGFLGFVFAPWVPLIVGMILSGYLGTVWGTRLLDRLSEAVFRIVLRALVTALAVALIAQGLLALS